VNADWTPGVAIADSDGDATSAPTVATVETQTNNNNMAPQITIHDLLGAEKQAATVLATVSPGEAATVASLDRIVSRMERIQVRLDADELTDQERAAFQTTLDSLGVQHDAKVAKLDQYSKDKVAAAMSLAPNLSLPALERIVAIIVNPQVAGNDKAISDAQGESIGEAVKAAFDRDPKGGDGD
jgi:hypothetical protein